MDLGLLGTTSCWGGAAGGQHVGKILYVEGIDSIFSAISLGQNC